MNDADATARAFINRFQGGFPIAGTTLCTVSRQDSACTEAVLIQTVRQLLDDGHAQPLRPAVRRRAARRRRDAGGACAVPEARLRPGGRAWSTPCRRWRTTTGASTRSTCGSWSPASSPQGVAECLDRDRAVTGLRGLQLSQAARVLPRPVAGARRATAASTRCRCRRPIRVAADAHRTRLDRRIIAATQARPAAGRASRMRQLAAQLDAVGRRGHASDCARMLASGVIRRIGAVPNHYRLGLRGNGMTVWDVPDELAVELGERVGALDFVSHCYQRPRHPGVWPLQPVRHGARPRSRRRCWKRPNALPRCWATAAAAHDVLFSSAVLKKTGLRLAA